MIQRERFQVGMWCLAVLLFVLAPLLHGCPGSPSGGGQLKTNLDGNLLNVGEIEPLEKVNKSFRIFNEGTTPITITGIEVQKGSGVLSWSGLTGFPVTLAPGEENGKDINITFKPESTTTSGDVGRLIFKLENALQTRTFVIVKATIKGGTVKPAPGQLSWECGGRIEFGVVLPGQSLKRQCQLKNVGKSDVIVKGFDYKYKQGSPSAFVATGLSLPYTMKPDDAALIDVEYKADGGAEVDSGAIVVNAEPATASAALEVSATQQQKQQPCELKTDASELTFSTAGTQTIRVSNVGGSDCTIYRVYLQNNGKGVFTVDSPGINLKIIPAGALDLKVTFAPGKEDLVVDDLVIESDAPVGPRLRIPLRGQSPSKQPCKLSFQPASLAFGYVDLGQTKTLKLNFTNIGEGSCQLTWKPTIIGLSPPNHNAFGLISASAGTNLAPRDSFGLIFMFKPTQAARFEGEFTILTNEPTQPRYVIKLSGSSQKECLEVSPASLDFGSSQPNCSSLKKTVTLRHTGESGCNSINVSAMSLNNQAFQLHSSSGTQKLDPNSSLQIELSFKPTASGVVKDQLSITTDAPGQQQIQLDLIGEGTSSTAQTDTFQQSAKTTVDILFLMDDSASMVDDQYRLAQEAQTLFNWLARLNVDYHIGVATTDVTGRRFSPGCLRGTTTVITPQSTNPAATFATNIRVGGSGSGVEKGLEGSYQVFQPKALAGCNKGFYRPSANLSIIYISDEGDASSQSVSFYINFFKTLKGAAWRAKMRASVVGGPLPGGCRSSTGASAASPRYISMAQEFGGVQASICDVNWGNFLKDPANMDKFGLTNQTQFVLSRPVNPASLTVKVNGTTIPQDPAKGWSYDTTSNSIIFSLPALPPANAVIVASYQAACLP